MLSLQLDANNFYSLGLQYPLQNCSHTASLFSQISDERQGRHFIFTLYMDISLMVNFNTISGNIDLVQLSSAGNFIRNSLISLIIKLLIFNMFKVSSSVLQSWWSKGLLPSFIQQTFIESLPQDTQERVDAPGRLIVCSTFSY